MTILFGILEVNMQHKQNLTVRRGAAYANALEARNMDYAVTDLAIAKLDQDTSWRNNGQPWTQNFQAGSASVLIEKASKDTLKLTATSNMGGKDQTVITWVAKHQKSSIPDIYAALGIYTNNFGYSGNGTYQINGNDQSGLADNLHGAMVKDQTGKNIILNSKKTNIVGIGGTPSIGTKSDMNFTPISDMVSKLVNSPSSKYLPTGVYNGDLGSPQNPGVYVIDNYVKLAGGVSDGYGIMIVRSNGDLDLSGDLDVKGNFTFHGLIIFEDGWSFSAGGTPQLNGAVVVGSSDPSHYIDISLQGTVDINYNSADLKYAKMAANPIVNPAFIYKTVKVYE